jgi:hypothetical protein
VCERDLGRSTPLPLTLPHDIASRGEPFHHESVRLRHGALQNRRPRRVRPERESLPDVQRTPLPHDREVALQHGLFVDHAGQRDVERFIEDWQPLEVLVRDIDEVVGGCRGSVGERVDLQSLEIRDPRRDLLVALLLTITRSRL